jgi:hypothetical protein
MAAARVRRRRRRWAAVSSAWLCLLPLGGCADLDAGAEQAASSAAPGTEPRPVEGALAISPDLVPEPAVFETVGTARWDGRRTLQGVWVAHPQANGARRVRIYNAATGAAADGALFAREATLSGPPILVSSDAAAALGLTPGVETELRIVALSRPAHPAGQKAPATAPAAAPDTAAAGAPATAQPAPRP